MKIYSPQNEKILVYYLYYVQFKYSIFSQFQLIREHNSVVDSNAKKHDFFTTERRISV